MAEDIEIDDLDVEEDLSNDPDLKAVLDRMATLKGKLSVYDLDFLLDRLKQKDAKKKELEKVLKRESKVFARIKSIATAVLKDLEREDYKGPGGSISIKHIMQVKMPQNPEAKSQLWAWMREKQIYDRYATVHATALKSLFDQEMKIAEQDQGEAFDPITFSLPGMGPATFFDDLKFTPAKK